MSRGLSHERTRNLLELLTDELPAIRRSVGIPPDTCVMHAHLVVEVVRAAGGMARAFPVKVRALSAECVRRMEAGEEVPEYGTPEAQAWIDSGATIVALGYGGGDGQPVGPDRYDGHLCALVSNRYLVDLSADQLQHRSRGNVKGEPFWSAVPREFVRGEDSIGFELPHGGVAIYEPHLGCRDYLRTYEGQDPDARWKAEPQLARDLLRFMGWRP